MAERVPVLLAAGGAAWEAAALGVLTDAGVVVVKRCVDLADLIGTADTGQADVAVISGVLPGLDVDAVQQLRSRQVHPVAVGGDPEALSRLGVSAHVPDEALDRLPGQVRAAVARTEGAERLPAAADDPQYAEAAGATGAPGNGPGGRVVAVHGPAGAPGRTTVAIALAAARAAGGSPTALVDADPHGGAVAQHLGILDEVSGLLAAARLANAGALDRAGLARCLRNLSGDLDVLTGLPRPDRWIEVRSGVLDTVLDVAASAGDVVVDTGFSLEDDGELGRPVSRNQLTLDAVAAADEVVVVGSADPTGLARLARTLVDLGEVAAGPEVPVRVVVNRMRDSLGWSRHDVAGMVEGYVRPVGMHFLPEDRGATDRALVAGRSVMELGDSPLRRALAELHEEVFRPR